jgi:hypothetical protein
VKAGKWNRQDAEGGRDLNRQDAKIARREREINRQDAKIAKEREGN